MLIYNSSLLLKTDCTESDNYLSTVEITSSKAYWTIPITMSEWVCITLVASRRRPSDPERHYLLSNSAPARCCILSTSGPLDCLLHFSLALQTLAELPAACPSLRWKTGTIAMISPEFNFNILTRDLSHYLENQVKVGLFGSGVGLSLVLGFSAAYTCYYIISVAKVNDCFWSCLRCRNLFVAVIEIILACLC